MLFSNETLSGIAEGRLTLAFRRWTRPRVKAGTRMRTRIGVVEVLGVEQVDGPVPPEDLAAAGFDSPDELKAWLDDRPGDLYRIELRAAGPDPRIALRDDADLTDHDVADLTTRLARMDRAAPEPWTWQTLRLIGARPAVVSTELAAELGEERLHFKARVRRLKELGLTESLPVGYRLSPRGEALLKRQPKGNAG